MLKTKEMDGRGAEIRTRDLLLPKQARYQAAPRPANPSSVSNSRAVVILGTRPRLDSSRQFSLNEPFEEYSCVR